VTFLAGRAILSVTYAGLPSGRYYWEHCYWVESSDFPSNAQMYLAVNSDMKLLYGSNVAILSQRYFLPNTSTVFFTQNASLSNVGSLTPLTNPTLLIAARWRMRGSDGSRSYHLHRQTMGDEYLLDGTYSTTGRSQCQTRINTFIAQGIYRTHSGALITEGQLAPVPAMWQLRHGTKRRASKFWLP